MKGKPLSQQTIANIVADYQQGIYTHKQIGARNGCSWYNVSPIIQKLGIARMGEPTKRQTTNADVKEIEKRYKSGKTSEQIALSLGMNSRIVAKHVKKLGIVRKKAVPSVKQTEVKRLYLDERLSTTQIATRLNINKGTVKALIGNNGLSRTRSEATCISIISRHKKGIGGLWHSTKTGKWEKADSKMELVRMSQLDQDATVKEWTRTVPIIKYGERNYRPDLFVQYHDGRTTIEEVKPTQQHRYKENLAKWEAAREYCEQHGHEFKVVSETDLGGRKYVNDFQIEGFQQPDFEMRKKLARQRKRESDKRCYRNRMLKKQETI